MEHDPFSVSSEPASLLAEGVAESVAELGRLLLQRRQWLATAESCTGGLGAHVLTGVSGASAWFRGAVVAYANELKTSLLGVDPDLIQVHGAVSEPVVLAMARGARRVCGADWAWAVSGVAGPTGGGPDKPVGTVWMAWAGPDRLGAERFLFQGTRGEIKARSVAAGVDGLLARLGEGS